MGIISSRPTPRRIRAKRRQRNCESCRKALFRRRLHDLETPLTKLGHEQARETGRYISRYEFDVIFSSPYHRALQTAEDLTSALPNSPPLVLEERIREIEFGILDGLTGEGIKVRFPQEYERRKREGKYWYRHQEVRAARMSRCEYRVSLEP